MNGATLFGVALSLFALTFALSDKLEYWQQIMFFCFSYLYLVASVISFFFPWLSE